MAEEGILGAFARIASTFVGGAPDAHKHVWNALAPWLAELTKSANTRWLPHLVHGIPCEVLHRDERGFGSRCHGSAIAACAICRKPCCLNHSFVSGDGLAACFPCVATAQQEAHARAPQVNWPKGTRGNPDSARGDESAAPPPPPREERPKPLDERIRAARKILRVKSTATWPEIEASYKALLAQHHPDKHPLDRDAATERFKRIRSAYDLLKQTPGAHP